MFQDFTPKFTSFGFKILQACRNKLTNFWKCKDACDPFVRLYFVKSGQGFLQQGENTIPLEGGYAYIIPANCTFSYGCETLDKIWFHINIYDIDKIDLFSAFTEIKRFPFSEAEFDALHEATSSNDYSKLINTYYILYKILYMYISSQDTPISVKQYSPLITQTLLYIQKNLRISLSADEISATLHVATSTLRQKFKKETGMTLRKYIEMLVFSDAKRLLMDETLSIDEISNRLDFCDRFYFSNRFKEFFGLTPAKYRKYSTLLTSTKH